MFRRGKKPVHRNGAVRILGVLTVVMLATWGHASAFAAGASQQSLHDLRDRLAALREPRPALLGGSPLRGQVAVSGRAAAASARLEARFGDRFAGAWDLPTSTGSTAVVALVDPTAADGPAATLIVGAATKVVAVEHSLAELTALESEVATTLGAAGAGDFAVGVHVPTNTVSLYVDDSAVVSAEAAEGVLALAERAEIVTQSVDIGTTAYPNPEWAGQRVFLGNGSGGFGACTTGFAMRNAFGNFMTTAAHCTAGVGQPVRAAAGDGLGGIGAQVATVSGWQPTGNVPGDFAAFYFNNVAGYVNGANRSVKGARDPQWLEQNVCFRGATSGVEKCAGVSDVNLLINTDGRTFRAFCIDHFPNAPALGGDSGSAVYQATAPGEAHARGILSGTVGSRSCSTPISVVMNNYSASILVK